MVGNEGVEPSWPVPQTGALPLGELPHVVSYLMAGTAGFEPAISSVTGRHVSQLHQVPIFVRHIGSGGLCPLFAPPDLSVGAWLGPGIS